MLDKEFIVISKIPREAEGAKLVWTAVINPILVEIDFKKDQTLPLPVALLQ